VETTISTFEKVITRLQSIYEPISLEDDIPHAGRKLFALHFSGFLSHVDHLDDASALPILIASGRQAVHITRIFPLFQEDKRVKTALTTLRKVVVAAQSVTLYRELLSYAALNDIPQTDDETPDPLEAVRQRVESRAAKAESQLISLLDSDDFSQAVKRLSKAIKSADGDSSLSINEYEVRHGAPILLHSALAAARHYDAAVIGEDAEALSHLYESLLRLRDTVGYFRPVLGASINDFEERCLALSETLHPVYRNQFAQQSLRASKKMDDAAKQAFADFLASLQGEAEEVAATFPDQWASFNTRTSQRKFSDALLVLR